MTQFSLTVELPYTIGNPVWLMTDTSAIVPRVVKDIRTITKKNELGEMQTTVILNIGLGSHVDLIEHSNVYATKQLALDAHYPPAPADAKAKQ